MASATHDKKGRPIVAVTGIGVVTSLGVGTADNWAKLTGGVSGIRRISRFPTDALRTTIAGTVDDGLSGRHVAGGSSPSALHCSPAKKLSPKPVSARRAVFPDRCFSRRRRSKSSGPTGSKWPRWRRPNADTGYPDLHARRPRLRRDTYEPFKFAIIGEDLADHFGTEGSPISLNTACASGASAIQLGMEAIRRGECEAALAIGADASITPELLVRFSLLSALSTQNDPPDRASKPFSKNRDGFVLAEGAAALVLESLDACPRARRPRARHSRRLRREIGFVPSHPHQPRRQADHRHDAAGRWPMPASGLRTSTISTRMAPRRPRTTRWSISACRLCSASASAAFRSRPTNR